MKYLMKIQKEELPHITEQEYQKLLLKTYDLQKRLILEIMWCYGLRPSEVLLLTKDDIIKTDDGFQIRIRRLKKRKPRITILPLKFDLGLEIQRYIDAYGIRDKLFTLTRQALWSWLQNLSKSVLNRKIGPRHFRHGRVYDLIKKGANWLEIIKLLDWEDPRLLLTYFHPTMEDMKNLIERT
jgi:integrase